MDFYELKEQEDLDLLNELASKGIKIKIIVPSKVTNKDNVIDHIKLKYQHIQFRNLQFSLQMVIGITIVDRDKKYDF